MGLEPTQAVLAPAGNAGQPQPLGEVEATPTPTAPPTAPRSQGGSELPAQQALVVAGPPDDQGSGGGSGSGGSADSQRSIGGGSSSLPLLGDLNSNAVLLLSLLAAVGLPAVAIGGRIYQMRRE